MRENKDTVYCTILYNRLLYIIACLRRQRRCVRHQDALSYALSYVHPL